MSDIFNVGETVDLESLAEGHGLEGTWIKVTPIISFNLTRPPTSTERAVDKLVMVGNHTAIYCDSGDDVGKIKYIDNNDNTIKTPREAYVYRAKLLSDESKDNLITQKLNLDKKVKYIFEYISSAEDLAESESKTEDVVKKDVRVKVNADKDYSTVESEIETDWSISLDATKKSHLKRIFNGSAIKKWVKALNVEVATKKGAIDTFDADGSNTDEDVLNYDSKITGTSFPTLQE